MLIGLMEPSPAPRDILFRSLQQANSSLARLNHYSDPPAQEQCRSCRSSSGRQGAVHGIGRMIGAVLSRVGGWIEVGFIGVEDGPRRSGLDGCAGVTCPGTEINPVDGRQLEERSAEVACTQL